MLPLYSIAIVATFAVTLMVLQVGSAHVLERRAETAADASALAAADRLGRVVSVGTFGIQFADRSRAQGAAENLAERNDAELVGIQINSPGVSTWTVTTTVETEEGVMEGLVGEVIGTQARSTSTATLSVGVTQLPGSSRQGTSADDLGLAVRDDSALREYAGQRCPAVDTDNLSDDMKVAILGVEAQLGRGLRLDRGHFSAGCLGAEAVYPELSPAIRGDEILLSPNQPGWQEAADIFSDRGFCVSGTTVVTDGSLACRSGGDLSSLVTVRTRLVPNP